MSDRWDFSPADLPPYDCVASGGTLNIANVLDAYQNGLFPMPDLETNRMYWWCPVHRGVLYPKDFHVSRSLRRSAKRFTVTFDQAFREVINLCADLERDGRWINDEIKTVYTDLYELGWAHSVEVWNMQGELVGGIYGVAIGGLFAGESMFHLETDASKIALKAVVDLGLFRLIDVQWLTQHLASLGAVEIDRTLYLRGISAIIGPDPKPKSWK